MDPNNNQNQGQDNQTPVTPPADQGGTQPTPTPGGDTGGGTPAPEGTPDQGQATPETPQGGTQ